MEKNDIILIIDQNINRRNNLSSRLRMIGYNTELCDSGFQAIHLIEKIFLQNSNKKYRLVLIMGDSEDMPGREIMLLIREVVKDKTKLPILIVDQDHDPENILSMIKEGANDYVVDIKNDAKILAKIQKFAPLA